MPKDSSDIAQLLERARAQLGMLITQFLLGMAVNLMGEPQGGLAKAVNGILLVLHVLVAIGIIVGAILTVRVALRLGGVYLQHARIGSVAVGLAVIGGLLTMGLKSDWWSFLMAIGFISAFVIYGLLYTKSRSAVASGRSGS